MCLNKIIKQISIFSSSILLMSSISYGHSDLLDIYKIAEKNDVIIRQQRALFNAAQQEEYITRGALLPQIDLSAHRNFTKIEHIPTTRRFYFKGYDLILKQILFDWAKWQTYLRSEPLITIAEKSWYLSNQELILRVTQAYVNILNAQDTLEFTEKEYAAINELYQESKARLEVGEITTADTDQVKADLDAVTAELYLARANVENRKDILQEITNVKIPDLAKLKSNYNLPQLKEPSLNRWLEIARKYNLNLQSAVANRKVAGHNISIAEAGYMPTVNLTARLRGNSGRRVFQNVTNTATQEFVDTFRVAIELDSPNLNPYGTIAQNRQARAEYHGADQGYIEEYRRTEREIKQYYRDVHSIRSEVQALKQAVKAAQSSLDATKENFDIGNRTYVIVLQRISELYSAKRNYSEAIYRYMLALLSLKNSAGTLDIKDLVTVNDLLYKHKPVKESEKSSKKST